MSNATSTSNNVSSTPSSNTYSTGVFWGVNVVIFTLAIVLVLWGVCGNSGAQSRLACCCRNRQRREEEEEQEAQEQERQQQQQLEREQLEKYIRTRDTPEQRRQKLEACFQKHNTMMTVTADDLIQEEEFQAVNSLALQSMEEGNVTPTNGIAPTAAPDAADMDHAFAIGDGHVMLKCQPIPRLVPNCCAVCLSNYEVGDVVVWSPNETCQHAFHRECILEWLVKMYKQRGLEMTQHNPCPCCRQEFAILESTTSCSPDS